MFQVLLSANYILVCHFMIFLPNCMFIQKVELLFFFIFHIAHQSFKVKLTFNEIGSVTSEKLIRSSIEVYPKCVF